MTKKSNVIQLPETDQGSTLSHKLEPDPTVISSPAYDQVMEQPTNSQVALDLKRKLEELKFLRTRIAQDAARMVELHDEVGLLIGAVNTGEYYLRQGLANLEQGLEYLKED